MHPDMTALVRKVLIEHLNEMSKAVHETAGPLTESEFWMKPVEPGNSFGHLVLHLTGNLNHFVGAQLGGTGYVRDREREFTETSLPNMSTALANLDRAVATFSRVVGGLTAEQFASPHPEPRFGTILNALLHLLTHFSLHRGQMSYIVRLVHAPDHA